MTKIIGISLVFVLGANFLLPIQADYFDDIGLGKLIQGYTTNEGVPGILGGLTKKIDEAACKLLGTNFLPLLSENNRCPKGSLAPNTFNSFENLCKCIHSNPCLSSAVITIPIKVKGVTDWTYYFAKCCNIEPQSLQSIEGGQTGDGLVAADFPRNSGLLLNGLFYDLSDKGGDLLCSLFGPRFLGLILTDNGCPSYVRTPQAFETVESFCYHLNYVWSSDIRKCMNDVAIRIVVRIRGVIHTEPDLGACCAGCSVRKQDNPSPQCKSTSPVNIPKC